MKVNHGHKLTEVGLIPDAWAVKPFGEIARIERGKFTARPRNDPKYYGGDVPFIQTGDIRSSGGRIRSFAQTLNQEGLKVSKLFPKETLFFTIAANIGELGFAAFDTACPDSLVAITPHSEIDKLWLYQELKSRKPDFEQLASSNAQSNLNLEKLRAYLLPVPTSGEQAAIGRIVGDADALVESIERLVAKKRLIKQGAMQDLLTSRRRLPGFGGGWSTFRFDQLFRVLRNASNSRSDLSSHGDVAYVHYGDIHISRSSFLNPFDLRTFIARGKVSTIPRIIDGDLLMADASEDTEAIGKAVEIVGLEGREAVAGLHTMALRSNNSLLVDGFKGYLQFLPEIRTALVRLATGVSVYGITKSGVKAIEATIPTPPEQTAIASVLSDMDAEIAALEAKLAKARRVKQGMMQELLTGRIRLV